MTTLHINVDEALADAAKQKAEQAGKTLEKWVADVVAQQIVTPAQGDNWVRRFLEGAKKLQGNSGGWKWKRDELYE